MIHLKYINNPFEAEMMKSISSFSEERSFYDCINRRFLNNSAFQHLEHSFYTYFLTGDCGEWLGYVLFSNENRVNGYYHYAYQKALDLLNDLRSKFVNPDNEKEITKLEKLVNENSNYFSISFALEEIYHLLSQDNENFALVDNAFQNYYKQLQEYLYQFPNYFYLDIVIALPKEEKTNIKKENSNLNSNIDLLAELKYYGFIQETFARVEEEIKQNFKNIPILLVDKNKNMLLINDEELISDKQLIKQIINVV